ncbi:hypothetical protein BCO18175_07407 [Burkholderia contaminans]|uniref:hypothetical protein n=1 Tax=Burkholderia contaminans TaxID=488447 RepID=UPI0014530FAF|nr:hypothetical protein [Burkholderia contaminans]VWD48235.1 hypothetical protein BCO18175_07407 [Burkholderia contaminans]
MNTYQVVIDEIKKSHGKTMKPCWIADTKEKSGVALRTKRTEPRQITCPPKWRPVIEAVLRKLGLIE